LSEDIYSELICQGVDRILTKSWVLIFPKLTDNYWAGKLQR